MTMSQRSPRKHVKHEHAHQHPRPPHPRSPAPLIERGDLLDEGPDTEPSIRRLAGELALAIAGRIVGRLLARPRRMLERVQAALFRRSQACERGSAGSQA
jgi:hypothetical protein